MKRYALRMPQEYLAKILNDKPSKISFKAEDCE